jgi:hypothetical protein
MFGYSYKSSLSPLRTYVEFERLDFNALPVANDVADVHGRARFGTALTACRARMMVAHIF